VTRANMMSLKSVLYTFDTFLCCVMAYQYGVELAIYRSLVQFPAGDFHVT